MANYHAKGFKEKKQFLLDCLEMMHFDQRFRFVAQLNSPRAELVFKERMGLYDTEIIPTLADLGRTLGITRSRVHQIERYSIDKALRILGNIDWVVPTDVFFTFVDKGLKRFKY